MDALLLCAGYGTRLGDIAIKKPKPLLEVGGKPVIDYLMMQISRFDLTKVHLISNNKYYNDFKKWNSNFLDIQIYNDGSNSDSEKLGAIGDMYHIMKDLHPTKLLVSAADNIFRFDLKPFYDKFMIDHCHYVLGLQEDNREKLQRTGVLEVQGNVVKRLHEKPVEPQSNIACPPIYMFQPSVWNIIEEYSKTGKFMDAPGHFINHLCQKQTVKVFKTKGERLDIGNKESYRQADSLLWKEPYHVN